jgi:hypothetical protein
MCAERNACESSQQPEETRRRKPRPEGPHFVWREVRALALNEPQRYWKDQKTVRERVRAIPNRDHRLGRL